MPSFFIEFCCEGVPSQDLLFTLNSQGSKLSTFFDDFHHIVNVFRHKKGDVIPVLNGCGYKAQAEIMDIDKKSLILRIFDITFTPPPQNKIACAFSLLKNKHDMLIVEKLTELGVTDLFPLTTKHSVRQSKENTIEKMKKVAISAIKQCDNALLPTIHKVQDLAHTIDYVSKMGYTPIVASEMKPKETLATYAIVGVKNHSPIQVTHNICILIGPEGGFDPSEFDLFSTHNIPQVSISNNILRAETAAICAVSQLSLLLNKKNEVTLCPTK